MQTSKALLVAAGSRGLCKVFVNRDLDRAQRLLAISPSLINLYHPLGWAPLHTAVLSGDPSLVKFALELPCTDITVKDKSSFNATSSAADIICRQNELCEDICGTESTSGATALHFACMRGNWEIINLLLEADASHDVKDDSGKFPQEYFDFERVNLETYEAYYTALKSWRMRWFVHLRKDMTVFLDAIREGDYDYCKKILDADPELAHRRHSSGWTALHVAVMNQKPTIANLILSRSTTAINERDSWNSGCSIFDCECGFDSSSDKERPPFASSKFADRALRKFTALHYACLLGDMVIVKALLKHGAKWTITDGNGLLPERYINVSNGNDTVNEFKRLCEEEELARSKLKQEKEGEPSKPSKNLEEDKESLSEEDEGLSSDGDQLMKRLKTQNMIEEIIGGKIIGQRGPIRAVASAIRLRDNGWVDPDRPLVLLFLGSSGIGKTELAKQVTYYLHGGKNKDKNSDSPSLNKIEESGAFVRIDMSEYQHDHTVSNLTGSPKGYVGYNEGGVLTTKLKENPRAIVLLDEIEKAHPDVLTVFLQVFDDGRITDPKFGTIYCQGAVFIMTSNLGSEEIRAASPKLHRLVAETENRHEQYLKSIGQFNKALHPVLKKAFKRDEFLGRINQIVVFLPLTNQEISQVIEIELKKWQKRAEEQHLIRLSWSPKVVERLVESYDMNYGARSVINEVQRLAVQLVAESQIRGDIGKSWFVHLVINDVGDIDMVKENPNGAIPQRRGCRYVF